MVKSKQVDKAVSPAPGWRRRYVNDSTDLMYADTDGKRVVYVREEKRVRTPRDTWRVYDKERGVPPEPRRKQVITDGDVIDIVIREMILEERLRRRAVIEQEVDAAEAEWKAALTKALSTTARGRAIVKVAPNVEGTSLSVWEGVAKVSFRTPYTGDREDREDISGEVVINYNLGQKLREMEKAKRRLDDEQRMLRDDQLLNRRRQQMHEFMKDDPEALKEIRAVVERVIVKRGEAKRARVK